MAWPHSLENHCSILSNRLLTGRSIESSWHPQAQVYTSRWGNLSGHPHCRVDWLLRGNALSKSRHAARKKLKRIARHHSWQHHVPRTGFVLGLSDDESWSHFDCSDTLEVCGPDAIPSLKKAVRCGSTRGRGLAANVLVHMGRGACSVLPDVLAALRNEKDAWARWRMLSVVNACGGEALSAYPGGLDLVPQKDDPEFHIRLGRWLWNGDPYAILCTPTFEWRIPD